MAQPNFCFRKHNLHSFQKLVFRHSNLGGKFNCLLLAGSGYWEALHEADWKGIACQRRALLMNGAPSSCSFCERVGKEKAGLSGSCLIKTKTDVLIRPVAWLRRTQRIEFANLCASFIKHRLAHV